MKMTKKSKLICFDMDDTILDSNRAHIEAYNLAFQKNNLPIISGKRLKALFGIVGEELIKRLFPKLNSKKIKMISNDHIYFLINKTKKYLKPFKDTRMTLRKLKKKYKLALLSNCTHREIIASLEATKVDKNIFDTIVGNDDVKHGKPYPDEILKAKKLLHMKAAYMIGDSIYDVMAGKKAGVRTIAVLTGNHSRSEIKKYKPDYIMKNLSGINKIL